MSVNIKSYTNRFNRGEIDKLAIARDDVDKLTDSAELVENFIPLRLGPMMYRPGTRFIDDTGITTGIYLVEFIASTTDTALLEFSNNLLRIRIPANPLVGHALITRTSVTSTILNGTFDTDLANWTDADDPGAVSDFKTPGVMSLIGDGAGSARRHQTMGTTQTGAEHALRLVIINTPIMLQLGTGVSGDEIFSGILKPGTHSLVFTPTSAVTITVSNVNVFEARIDSIELEVTGTFSLPTVVTSASLPSIRYSQSADVVFIAYDSGEQFAVERRGTKSWSIVRYLSDDGPFDSINSTDIFLTPSAFEGNGTLTANKSYFKNEDVGTLFKLTQSGQTVEKTVSNQDSGTESIKVTGITTGRAFVVNITGMVAADTKVSFQRSTDNLTWTNLNVFQTDQAIAFNDTFDESIIYYRLWVVAGDFVSATPFCQLLYPAGGGTADGIARIASFTSDTVVNITILKNFKSIKGTRDWNRGEWGGASGFPTAVSLYEGRLWWAGKTKTWGSVSDAFSSFDDTIEGDSAPIRRTIGFGPVDKIEWLLPLNRLLMGIASDELSIRSTSLGVVLTRSNANIKPGSNQGSAPVQPVKVNSRGYFIQRSLTKIFELEYTFNQDTHSPIDLTLLNPSICAAGIKRIAVTVQPETRIFVVLNDGSARVYLMDKTENVTAWSRITTDGTFQDVVVVPTSGEDRVYFVIDRTGGTYFEILALFGSSIGGLFSQTFDSLLTFNSPGTTITGLGHLEGKVVGVWGDSQYRESQTVSGGQITVSSSWAAVSVGLRYVAKWQSTKLSRFDPKSVLTYRKRVVDTGFILANYWPGSITVGPSASELGNFPLLEDGKAVILTATQSSYDQEPFAFKGGSFESDPRIYIEANNPCTILAMTYGVDESRDPRKTIDDQ